MSIARFDGVENTLHERETRARRQCHVRAFWRIWLAQLDGGFNSRVTLGAVGALWRSQTFRRDRKTRTQAQVWSQTNE
jgi:hypothetical protein